MKQFIKGLESKTYKLFALFLLLQTTTLFAQDTKVEINGNDVGTWFGRNWLWVTGGIVLLLLIIIFGFSGGRRSKSTTITNRNGEVKRTITELED
ncbi:MAG: hypothetical protein NVSMB63_17930 [Sediminibacterium sp.]